MVESALQPASPVHSHPPWSPPRPAPLWKLYNPSSWSQDSGDICFLLTRELKLNRKMCLALNWVLLAGNRETLGKQGRAGSQEWVSGVTGAFTSHFTSGFGHCWLLAEPQNHLSHSLSLAFGNPLARVSAVLCVFFSNMPWAPRSLRLCSVCSSHSEHFLLFSLFPSAAGKSSSSLKGQFLCHLPQHTVPLSQGLGSPSSHRFVLPHHHRTSLYIWHCHHFYILYFLSLWSPFPTSFIVCILCIIFSRFILEGGRI